MGLIERGGSGKINSELGQRVMKEIDRQRGAERRTHVDIYLTTN